MNAPKVIRTAMLFVVKSGILDSAFDRSGTAAAAARAAVASFVNDLRVVHAWKRSMGDVSAQKPFTDWFNSYITEHARAIMVNDPLPAVEVVADVVDLLATVAKTPRGAWESAIRDHASFLTGDVGGAFAAAGGRLRDLLMLRVNALTSAVSGDITAARAWADVSSGAPPGRGE